MHKACAHCCQYVGEVFGLILDVVETTRVEDVKACFNFMDSLWGTWSTLQAVAHRLAFQKVYNMFCRRISNNQDAEVLGAVASVVAKMMPFNDPAGLNTAFQCNQHQTPMDESIGVSTLLCPLTPFEAHMDLPLKLYDGLSSRLSLRTLAALLSC